MSKRYVTPVGTLWKVRVNDGPEKWHEEWLLKCPGCGQVAHLDDDQANGRVSVDHAADGCAGGYHETKDFVAAAEGIEPDDVSWREDAS